MTLKKRVVQLEQSNSSRNGAVIVWVPKAATEQEQEKLIREAKEKAGYADTDNPQIITVCQFCEQQQAW